MEIGKTKLGDRLRELRKAKGYTLRGLALRVDVGFSYLCKIETGKLEAGHYPSEALLHLLAEELDGDENELILLAQRIPETIRNRFLQQPNAFAALAALKDRELDCIVERLKTKST